MMEKRRQKADMRGKRSRPLGVNWPTKASLVWAPIGVTVDLAA